MHADKDERLEHLERCVFNARYGSELNEYGDTGNRRGGGRKRNWRKWFNQQPDDVLEEFGKQGLGGRILLLVQAASSARPARRGYGPRPELLTLGLACNTPRRRPLEYS